MFQIKRVFICCLNGKKPYNDTVCVVILLKVNGMERSKNFDALLNIIFKQSYAANRLK